MPRLEDMVDGGQREAVEQRLIGRNCFGVLKTGAITAAKNVERNRQFISSHLSLGGDGVGINVNQLYDPVAIGTAGGGIKVDGGRAAQVQGCGERFTHIGEHVGPTIDETLVTDQPGPPGVFVIGMDRSRPIRHRLAGSETYSS